jgi:Yip1 domain
MSALTDAGAGRVLGVLTAPGDTFRSIAGRPTWAAPLLVLVLSATAIGWMVTARIDLTETVRHRLEASGSQPSAEQLEQGLEVAKKIAPYLALFQGLVLAPAIYLLLALLLWVGFRLVGSEMGYRASLATTLHGLMPYAVAALLAIPVVWNRAAMTAEEARSGTFLMSNLAALAPAGAGPVERALLGSVDLFSLWAIVLLIIGCRIVARVSRAAAVGVVLSLWLLGVAVKVALVAVAPG